MKFTPRCKFTTD